AFLSVRDHDKLGVVPVARALVALGFQLVATAGTAQALELAGIEVVRIDKGAAVVKLLRGGEVDLVVNTPEGRNARRDGYAICDAAVGSRDRCITTLADVRGGVVRSAKARAESTLSLQERHEARAS